ncbi:MAG: alternative ribosome rescue aminoacyl-tRNA hydrolase ArfB [Gemmatimonadaceae bacterium]|nr:alternative ribosome rescue aminoacyl-tRNA hydrolase ArfB [Gemmatimonadaceae bacterium]
MSGRRADDDALPDVLRVNSRVAIPRRELVVRASRAGGPGGQHVNTSSTRVEVCWSVRDSRVISETDRARLATALAARLDGEGVLRVVAADTRSQTQNRLLAESRLAAVVAKALIVPKVRRPTAPSRAAKAARLTDKRRASEKKAARRRRDDD